MRLVLIALVLVSLGCAMKMTGTREISIGQQPEPMTELVALIERLQATVAELERTTDPTTRRELALRAIEMLKDVDRRLQNIKE